MKQGDIVIVSLDPTIGHEQSKTRPCVIIQCNTLNQVMGTTIIAPITSKIFDKFYPNVVSLHNDSLPKKGSIKIEQMRCIDKSRIVKKIGTVSEKELSSIKESVQVVFDMD